MTLAKTSAGWTRGLSRVVDLATTTQWLRRVSAVATALVVALTGLAAPAAAGPLAGAKPTIDETTSAGDVWQLDGRKVIWQSRGGFRFDLALDAPQDLTALTSSDDKIMLRGIRIERRIVGNMLRWIDGCPLPTEMPVRGWMNAEQTRVVITGETPVVEDCRVVGFEPFGQQTTLVLTRPADAGK